MRYVKAFLPLLLALTACNAITTFGTMNVQRSSLRGAGDLSVTIMLDRIPEAEVGSLQVRVMDFLDAVEDLANTGDFAALTRTELVDQLIAKVSPQYTHWVLAAIDTALAAIPPDAEIGEYNRRRILAFIIGSRAAVVGYNISDREAERGQVEPVLEGTVPPWPEPTSRHDPKHGDPRFPGSVYV